MSHEAHGRKHLQIVRGEGRAMLCIWEPGVIRSTREARSLAAAGCTHAALDPSPEMNAFLRLYADRFETHFGPAAFALGRICVACVGAEARVVLGELAELASEFGLSYLEPDGVVHVRLGAHEHLPVAAILALLASGVIAHVRLRDGAWRLGLRHAPDAFVATVSAASTQHAAALRLLGFRASRRGAWQQRFGAQTYATARSLVRVLRACLPAPADLEAVLVPGEALIPLVQPQAACIESALGTAGDT